MKDGCKCHSCGRLYRVDVIIPDELWYKIVGVGESMLCGICILARIEALGEFDAFQLIKL